MSIIKKLSSRTINLIAAGEVVERPASVVKELVENAIDAGATEIEVTVSTAGKNFISIKDNGCGMTAEDMQTSILRYATSKLNEDDIFQINSFGFRGEALPSIASISRLTMYSRTKDSEFGNKMTMESDEIVSFHISPCKIGTLIEVRDLFYAVPARLKFLKSDRSEMQYISEIFNKIALAHPAITFKLFNETKTLSSYPAIGNDNSRVAQVLGDEFFNHSIYIDYEYNDIKIKGYISKPTYNKRNSSDQYFYVNGRPVKDKFIQMAIRIAYQDVMPSDRFAACVLFISLPYYEIDVNVHPAKTEIRFRDHEAIRSAVTHAIKSQLESNSLHSTETTSKAFYDVILKPDTQKDSNLNLYSADINFPKPSTSLFQASSVTELEPQTNIKSAYIKPVYEPTPKIMQDLPIEVFYPLGQAKAQVFETYMISESKDKIFLIDIHAAHERIIYEQFKKQIKENGVKRQRLLFAENVILSEKNANNILDNAVKFSQFGFIISKSDNGIIITEVPAAVKVKNLQLLFEDIAQDINEFNYTNSIDEVFEHFYETLACHSSVRAGDSLSIPEMNHLLRQMEQTSLIDQCNHGRPTYTTINRKDFEKLFERT